LKWEAPETYDVIRLGPPAAHGTGEGNSDEFDENDLGWDESRQLSGEMSCEMPAADTLSDSRGGGDQFFLALPDERQSGHGNCYKDSEVVQKHREVALCLAAGRGKA
jgi:hypothetical protein